MFDYSCNRSHFPPIINAIQFKNYMLICCECVPLLVACDCYMHVLIFMVGIAIFLLIVKKFLSFIFFLRWSAILAAWLRAIGHLICTSSRYHGKSCVRHCYGKNPIIVWKLFQHQWLFYACWVDEWSFNGWRLVFANEFANFFGIYVGNNEWKMQKIALIYRNFEERPLGAVTLILGKTRNCYSDTWED